VLSAEELAFEEQVAQDAFDEIDADRSGSLDREEVGTLCKR
jgi:Ca2+-binding EF-hand superfamily protein